MSVKTQSVEPNVADLGNGWLKSHKLDYKLEQESLNTAIDKALDDYYSKNGGVGGNRPDVKLLLNNDRNYFYPVIIEYKGYKDKLSKLDANGVVDNRTSKNEPNLKNINAYAVNGAVHYANALLHHTSYTDIIAIGMTGYKNEGGILQYEIDVYHVSKSNLGAGQRVGDYTDFSFLAPEHFSAFIDKVNSLSLPPDEMERLKAQREQEIDAHLVRLNNHIYQNEKGLGENDRVYLVAASIIATLGVPGRVEPLEKSDLKSSNEQGNRDGDIMVRKIRAFLNEKNIPHEKSELILRTLQNTLTTENLNKVVHGETQLKRVFSNIVDDLGIYYKIGLTTDFTGKLFNEMYGWLGFSQDRLNDVVLTPSYIATLLARLARVNKDSHVWDFATGSAGLLVAAMNEMLNDAKQKITSPEDLARKEMQIKAEQLLGLELLPSVYMLAILNMIMMGDGSANILNKDSLDFNGHYGYKNGESAPGALPADAFILNPPYSASGNGMSFVEKGLSMMNKGYAAIIIQGSAGSGKARAINTRILEKNTLLASIKMPMDLFVGKSSVQTYIYVFKVGEPHQEEEMVKFVDFSHDGYTRTNRKKASNNLRDADNAKSRYDELVSLVRFGRSQLRLFDDSTYYENTIDPDHGADWNQTIPVNTKPTLADFKQTVGDYLAWEISSLLKRPQATGCRAAGKTASPLHAQLGAVEWGEFTLGALFGKATRGKRLRSEDRIPGPLPFVTAGERDEGISAYIGNDVEVFSENTITIDMFGSAKYRSYQYGADDHIAVVNTKDLPKSAVIFVTSAIHKSSHAGAFNYGRNFYAKDADDLVICLPTKNKEADIGFMVRFIAELEAKRIADLKGYLAVKVQD